MVRVRDTTRRAGEGVVFEEQGGGRCRAGDSGFGYPRGYMNDAKEHARLTCISNGLKSYHKRCFCGRKRSRGVRERHEDGVRCRERERGLRQRRQRRQRDKESGRHKDQRQRNGQSDRQSGRDGERRKEGESLRGDWSESRQRSTSL